MDGFNIDRIFAGLRNPELYLKKLKQNAINNGNSQFNSTFSETRPNTQLNNPINSLVLNNLLQMNQIATIDRAIYIRNLLGLPQSLSNFLLQTQTNNNQQSPNSLIINNLNENLLANQKILSEIFDETLDLSNNIERMNANQVINTSSNKDAMQQLFFGMINLHTASETILKNSKQAINGLIIAMASASKQGITNEQIADTLKVINSCVAMAESNDSMQNLKSLMLLYLPWLPLHEEIGFDIEAGTPDDENKHIDSKLIVLIQTKNFGNIKGVFTLSTTNSVDILVLCSELFPKTLLLKSLNSESKSLSVTTTIDVESFEQKNDNKDLNTETKVNLSSTNEINPYLLLLAHAFIRNTIYIDSNALVDNQ